MHQLGVGEKTISNLGFRAAPGGFLVVAEGRLRLSPSPLSLTTAMFETLFHLIILAVTDRDLPDLSDVQSVLVGDKWSTVQQIKSADLDGWVRLIMGSYQVVTVRASSINAIKKNEFPDQPPVETFTPWK